MVLCIPKAGVSVLLIALSSSIAIAGEEDRPFTFSAVYTGEAWGNARGGMENGTRYLHNIDLTLEADLSFAGLEDTTLFVYGLHTNSPEFSGDLVGDAPNDYKTNLELSYRAQLTDWLAVQPDIQYIINPGAVSGLRDALALGIRLEIGTTF